MPLRITLGTLALSFTPGISPCSDRTRSVKKKKKNGVCLQACGFEAWGWGTRQPIPKEREVEVGGQSLVTHKLCTHGRRGCVCQNNPLES